MCVARCRLLLQQQPDAVVLSPVDRLTELLLDSTRTPQSVTNGNQELSSEWPALAAFRSWLLQVVVSRRFSMKQKPLRPTRVQPASELSSTWTRPGSGAVPLEQFRWFGGSGRASIGRRTQGLRPS